MTHQSFVPTAGVNLGQMMRELRQYRNAAAANLCNLIILTLHLRLCSWRRSHCSDDGGSGAAAVAQRAAIDTVLLDCVYIVLLLSRSWRHSPST